MDAAHRRRMSAPSVSETFCGAMTLPLDLRHLVALAVDDEAVRQQRLVRRAAVDGAAGQQRRLEPAAMLVGAFQVQVGRVRQVRRGASRAARCQWVVPESNQTSSVSLILRYCVGLGAEQFARRRALNQASMPACSTRCATCSISSAVRGCSCAGFLVHEERHRHAPVALARDAPVRAGLHHRFEPGAAPGREELRSRRRRARRSSAGSALPLSLALRGFHADEPLRAWRGR